VGVLGAWVLGAQWAPFYGKTANAAKTAKISVCAGQKANIVY
jgi:hypothetical protein